MFLHINSHTPPPPLIIYYYIRNWRRIVFQLFISPQSPIPDPPPLPKQTSKQKYYWSPWPSGEAFPHLAVPAQIPEAKSTYRFGSESECVLLVNGACSSGTCLLESWPLKAPELMNTIMKGHTKWSTYSLKNGNLDLENIFEIRLWWETVIELKKCSFLLVTF